MQSTRQRSIRRTNPTNENRKVTIMSSISRFAPTAARILLGLVFFVFGLNGFLGFLPQPPMPDKAGAFMGALAATGYMFPLIKGVEVIAGALLLANRFVPLALALLAPNVVNIVLFHSVLAPGGVGVALFVLALELGTAWSYRDAYASMLRARVAPKSSATPVAVSAHAV
jgi:uncharacterized membrane protein YphA (DoxX/SURF4 family)